MGQEIEGLLQQVVKAMLGVLPEEANDAALYCEAESGVVSASIIYLMAHEDRWIYRFGGRELSDLLYGLWEIWPQQAGDEHWSALGVVLSNGRVQVHPIYASSFDSSASSLSRRTDWFLREVGVERIDYSQAA